MKYLGSLRIGTRLKVGFGIALLLLLMTGGLAMLQASRIYGGTREIAGNWLPSVQTLGDIRALANGVRRASLRSIMESDVTAKQSQRAQHDADLSSFNAAMAAYEKLVSSPEEQQITDNLKNAWSAYMTSDAKLLELSESGDAGFAAARTLATGESARLFTQALRLIEQDVKLNRAGAATQGRSGGQLPYDDRFNGRSVRGCAAVVCCGGMADYPFHRHATGSGSRHC